MLKELFTLVSEAFGLFSAVLSSDTSEEISDEIKKFTSLVAEKNYMEAGTYFVECIKNAVELGIDDIVLHASRANLDLTEMAHVKSAISESETINAESGNKPDSAYKKAVNILNDVLTYT